MIEPGTLRGAIAQVKYAYLTAAVVTNYLIRRDALTKSWTLVGIAKTHDPYLIAQTPLVLVIATKRGAIRWPIESCTIADFEFHARLGALGG